MPPEGMKVEVVKLPLGSTDCPSTRTSAMPVLSEATADSTRSELAEVRIDGDCMS